MGRDKLRSKQGFLRLGLIAVSGALLGAGGALAAHEDPAVVARVAVGVNPRLVAVNQETSRVYVPNSGDNTVSVIDGESNAVVATVAVGSSPAGAAANPGLNRIYVANAGGNTVSVIDGGTNVVIATVPVGVNPRGVTVNPKTGLVYVANFVSNTVTVIDGAANTVVTTLPVAARGLIANPETNLIYATNTAGNSVAVIDGDTNTVIAVIPVGNSPVAVDLDRETNLVYVANRVSQSLSVIDGDTNTVAEMIPLGGTPFGVGVNAVTGRVYVAISESGSMAVIDAETNAVVGNVAVGAFAGGAGVGVDAKPDRVYVSNFSNSVSVLADAPRSGFQAWSAPIHLGPVVNSAFEEEGPEISTHGLSLYFYSLRPGGLGGEDLWVTQRPDGESPWGAPVNLGSVLNTPADERAPALSRDGHLLFFASSRPGGRGGLDLWVARREHTDDDLGWKAPQNLGPINTAANDTGPTFFEGNETSPSQLYFVSNRPGGLGLADIYLSEQAADGSFGPAVLVRELSSPALDTRPSIRHDGREIFFGSQRAGGFGGADLWGSTREDVSGRWSTPVNLGPTVNSEFAEGTPGLSSDGTELYLHSDRPDALGDDDLYVSVRTKRKEP